MTPKKLRELRNTNGVANGPMSVVPGGYGIAIVEGRYAVALPHVVMLANQVTPLLNALEAAEKRIEELEAQLRP